MQLLNIGFGNTVMVERIVAVINTGSSPARKLKEAAKNEGRLVDVTEGRRTRSILVMDSNHVILCSVQPDTISQRLQALQTGHNLAEYQNLVQPHQPGTTSKSTSTGKSGRSGKKKADSEDF